MQASLFGEPELKPALSQWFTPPWLARKLATWVPRGARILEPSCGRGNLIGGLLAGGHALECITALDVDNDWARHVLGAWPALRVVAGDFLADELFNADEFDVVEMNPPFEDEGHLRFVLRAFELAPVVVGVFPVSFEFGRERDRLLWASAGVVTRRARLPARVDYGGDQSPSFDTVALRIERRDRHRMPNEVRQVLEEVWLP